MVFPDSESTLVATALAVVNNPQQEMTIHVYANMAVFQASTGSRPKFL